MKIPFGILVVLAATSTAIAGTTKGMQDKPYKDHDEHYGEYLVTPDARVLLGHTGNIFLADFFSKSGELSISLNETVQGDPSWMAFAPPNRLYAVDEFSNTLRYFELDLDTNKLKLVDSQNGSLGVVHLEFNHDQTRLVGSAFGNGTVDIWNIENGCLELIKTIPSEGQLGPNKERQASAHPHQANRDPSGRFFAVNDLGTDSVLIVDSKYDKFDLTTSVSVEPAGCGPRHGVWFPKGASEATHYIAVCEITNQVLVFSVEYKKHRLQFTQIQTSSTFGKDFPPANVTTAAAAEIVLAQNNRDIYISNRLTGNATDSIAHFVVKESKWGGITLKFADTTSSGGINPRMISIGLEEDVVFSANLDGKLGLSALEIRHDGALMEVPIASLPGSMFGEPGAGPQFAQQIA